MANLRVHPRRRIFVPKRTASCLSLKTGAKIIIFRTRAIVFRTRVVVLSTRVVVLSTRVVVLSTKYPKIEDHICNDKKRICNFSDQTCNDKKRICNFSGHICNDKERICNFSGQSRKNCCASGLIHVKIIAFGKTGVKTESTGQDARGFSTKFITRCQSLTVRKTGLRDFSKGTGGSVLPRAEGIAQAINNEFFQNVKVRRTSLIDKNSILACITLIYKAEILCR